MADEDYCEVDAVVRIPKGERLANSRKTEGWSRGFTPKSTDKGPGHVEIRLKDAADAELDQEPEVVYVTEYVESPRRELTPSEQARADFLNRVIEDLYEVLKPVVAHWFKTRVVPAVKAKREELRQKRQERKATKALPANASESGEQDDATSQEMATVPSQPTISVTSEQFQELFQTWLAREDAQQMLWQAIASAHIEDGDAATLAWQQSLAELSPQERSERVAEILSSNPAILQGLGRLLAASVPLEAAESAPQRAEG
ncbi:hypothetical protein ISU10_12585 [Nocardioides agariphilus]|uniref:Uncharacterized protein n=1 Tax=Nocardioides agariphilus TaxID=433664 RepID=A0A930YMX7_9ACTN|nr:hypothetical protein [Nocardioides agariphilus]MBF4768599.1 hypothetical protein [Nocardioides agariphilus]